MFSPHHAILISPILSLGIAVPTDGVPAHTARLLDDEILTLIQATGNASLSLSRHPRPRLPPVM